MSLTRAICNLPPARIAAGLGRNGGSVVQLRAMGSRFWPWVRQDLKAGPIGGRRVLTSVWAASAMDDPLADRQRAILKVIFLDAAGHEFADAQRHFLGAGDMPGKYVQALLPYLLIAGIGAWFGIPKRTYGIDARGVGEMP